MVLAVDFFCCRIFFFFFFMSSYYSDDSNSGRWYSVFIASRLKVLRLSRSITLISANLNRISDVCLHAQHYYYRRVCVTFTYFIFVFLWRAFEFISDDNRNHRQLFCPHSENWILNKKIHSTHVFDNYLFPIQRRLLLLQNISHDGSDYGPCFFENTKMMTTVPIFLHSTRPCCLLKTLLAS